MNKSEMVKMFGKEFAEAIERECKKEKLTLCEFFIEFIDVWADDEFFDYMMDLCKKHNISFDDYDGEEI